MEKKGDEREKKEDKGERGDGGEEGKGRRGVDDQLLVHFVFLKATKSEISRKREEGESSH